MRDPVLLCVALALSTSGCKAKTPAEAAPAQAEPQVPTFALPTARAELRRRSDLAGQAVFRVDCDSNAVGTAFLHASGRVITAAHVARVCPPSSMRLTNVTHKSGIKVAAVTAIDDRTDIALLESAEPLQGGYRIDMSGIWGREPLQEIGEPVQWWGFPGGYESNRPLLGMGYFAGWVTYSDGPTLSYVVGGGVNPGNSGGPLLDYATGKVMGIVIQKRKNAVGFVEGLGVASSPLDVIDFLRASNIEP